MIAVAQTSGESHETVEEAKKGLDPYTYQLFSTSHHQTLSQEHSDPAFNSPGLFPRFTELVEYIFVNRSVAADNKHTTALAVSYCRQTLIAEALIDYGVKIEVDAEWERKLATAITENLGAIKAVRTYLKSMTDDESGRATFFRFWSAALRGMDMDETRSKMTCARVVVELCTLSPHTVLGEMAPHFNMIDDALLSNDVDVRGLAAHAYGLLASHLTTGSEVLKSSLDALFEKIEAWKDAIGADLNRVHGAVLALAYFISHRSEQSPDDNNVDRILQRFLPLLFDMLENCSDLLLQDACYLALGQLCLFFVISPKQIAEHMSLSTLISNLSKKAKTGNEKAIAVIGHLSMIIDEHDGSDLLRQLADEIYALHEVRQAETQFAVGEALSCLACGWESKGLVAKLDRDGPVPVGPKRTKAMTPLLDRVIADCSTTKPSLKKVEDFDISVFLTSDTFSRHPLYGYYALFSSAAIAKRFRTASASSRQRSNVVSQTAMNLSKSLLPEVSVLSTRKATEISKTTLSETWWARFQATVRIYLELLQRKRNFLSRALFLQAMVRSRLTKIS